MHEATDEKLDRRVAIKELHEHLVDHQGLGKRFKREALAVAAVNHPGIVSIYDAIAEDPDNNVRPALVMEFVDGRSLREFLDDVGRLEANDVVTLGRSLCDSLEAVHQAGLVHRDVTPSNVLLCRNGQVKLADFGIAKAFDSTELTAAGSLVGTARYLAPEQLTDGVIDSRSDLYALGLVLFEAATGRRPFEGTTDAAAALARLDRNPPSPYDLDPAIGRTLSDAILWALRRDPADRPGRAADLSDALEHRGHDSSDATRTSVPSRVTTSVGVADPGERTDEFPAATLAATAATATRVPDPSGATTVDGSRQRRRRIRMSSVAAGALVGAAFVTTLALTGAIG